MTEKSLPRNRIEDARGRRVTQLDPIAMHLLLPVTGSLFTRSETIPAEPLREIATELDQRWAKFGHFIFLIYVVGLLLAYAGAIYFKVFISTSRVWDLVGILFFFVEFVFLFGVFYITWLIGKRARFSRVALVMLKHGRCPHCGYDLRGLSPDSQDRATVCPECGCAWLIDEAAIAGQLAAAAHAQEPLRGKRKVIAIVALLITTLLLGITFCQQMRSRAARLRRITPPPTATIAPRAFSNSSVGRAWPDSLLPRRAEPDHCSATPCGWR